MSTVFGAQTGNGFVIFTIGNEVAVNIPEARELEQFVVVFVITTLYVPGIVAEKLDIFPGLLAPFGTIHAYEYAPGKFGVAVKIALEPAQIVSLFTKAIGKAFTVTVPETLALKHEVTVFVITTL